MSDGYNEKRTEFLSLIKKVKFTRTVAKRKSLHTAINGTKNQFCHAFKQTLYPNKNVPPVEILNKDIKVSVGLYNLCDNIDIVEKFDDSCIKLVTLVSILKKITSENYDKGGFLDDKDIIKELKRIRKGFNEYAKDLEKLREKKVEKELKNSKNENSNKGNEAQENKRIILNSFSESLNKAYSKLTLLNLINVLNNVVKYYQLELSAHKDGNPVYFKSRLTSIEEMISQVKEAGDQRLLNSAENVSKLIKYHGPVLRENGRLNNNLEILKKRFIGKYINIVDKTRFKIK